MKFNTWLILTIFYVSNLYFCLNSNLSERTMLKIKKEKLTKNLNRFNTFLKSIDNIEKKLKSSKIVKI